MRPNLNSLETIAVCCCGRWWGYCCVQWLFLVSHIVAKQVPIPQFPLWRFPWHKELCRTSCFSTNVYWCSTWNYNKELLNVKVLGQQKYVNSDTEIFRSQQTNILLHLKCWYLSTKLHSTVISTVTALRISSPSYAVKCIHAPLVWFY
jgi:hypothetical protein